MYYMFIPHFFTFQLSMTSDGEGMGDGEKQLCHRVLYDFFHGRVSNPVEAGVCARV